MRRAAFIVEICLVASWASGMAVGDRPELKFKATNGNVVDLSQMQGKLVLVDFWATWCGPCMAEAGHMVELHQKYGGKGLEFVGISLDDDPAKMAQVAKASGFAWPQYFDGQVWQNKLARAWGVDSIPRTFLIGPDGTVLWTGHPAAIDKPLAKAFKEHPPVLVDPQTVEAAKGILKQVEAKIEAGDPAAAVKLMSTLPPDAKLDEKLAKRIDEAQQGLTEYATSAMEKAERLAGEKQYVEAIGTLKDLAEGMAGTPMEKTARAKLSDLMGDPGARQAVAELQRNAKGEEALAAAQKLKDLGKDPEAYERFKAVAKQFAGTTPGDAAGRAVAEYEKDPAFVKKANDAEAATKGKAGLSLADGYRRAGLTDKARKKYQEVVDQYPGTSYAETATRALAEMSR